VWLCQLIDKVVAAVAVIPIAFLSGVIGAIVGDAIGIGNEERTAVRIESDQTATHSP
jgi:ADP-ribosylglycohydrolase